MQQSPPTQASLLLRVRDPEDHIAWKQFVEIYLPLVHSYCIKRGLQAADASDVAQEVMRAVSEHIGRFNYDAKRGLFRGWLFAVVRSKLSNFVRQSLRHERGSGRTTVHDLLAEQPSAQETQIWDTECQRSVFQWALQQAQGQFEATTWQAFKMTAIEGRPAKDVAQATGLTVGAVYVAKSRVIARLQQIVKSVEED